MWNPVCFVGIDGSGKTTLALRVVKRLRERSVKSKYVWFRQPYIFSLPFLALCRAVRLSRVRRKGNLVWKDHNFKSRAVSVPWITLQFFDVWLFSLIRIRLPMVFGYTVVCDRTIHDILVDLIIDTGDHEIVNKPAGRLLLQLVPTSAAIFLLNVDERTAFKRKQDIPDIDYLRLRRRLYERFAKAFDIQVLQGSEKSNLDRILG